MKKNDLKFYLILFISFLLVSACSSDQEFDESIDQEVPTELDSQKEFMIEVAYPNQKGISVPIGDSDFMIQEYNGEYIMAGDIRLTPAQINFLGGGKNARTALSNLSSRWPNCTVYYTIDSNLSNTSRVTDAIDHWESNFAIDFVQRTNQSNYIKFVSGGGCSSFLGMIGGMQEITLAPGCTTGNAIHEIGHALGLLHEQQRTDRSNFITINWNNIISGFENNFQTYTQLGINGYEIGNLDFNSIMMYGSFAFSENGQPTITRLDGSTFAAQRNGLSSGDIDMINDMYSCALPPAYYVTANGPSYMPFGTNGIQWQYTGNVPNVQSIAWWYKKVGNTGVAPHVIATGTNGIFAASSDTYYSDPSTASSYFEIYVRVTTTSGETYTSGTYTIHKKGKYKLRGLIL